ncbi:MAG: TraR/DksA family transcriptional regulator [Rhodospirillaceae bacterium]
MPGDSGDLAAANAEFDREQALERVAAAFRASDGGGFGECQGCGEVIEPGRLEVMPGARRCVVCQERVEQRR